MPLYVILAGHLIIGETDQPGDDAFEDIDEFVQNVPLYVLLAGQFMKVALPLLQTDNLGIRKRTSTMELRSTSFILCCVFSL